MSIYVHSFKSWAWYPPLSALITVLKSVPENKWLKYRLYRHQHMEQKIVKSITDHQQQRSRMNLHPGDIRPVWDYTMSLA